MLRIPAALEKGSKDRLLPIAPEFAEFLLATPEVERTGYVFNPAAERHHGPRLGAYAVCKTVGDIGRKAGVKVLTKPDKTEKVKFASAHETAFVPASNHSGRLRGSELNRSTGRFTKARPGGGTVGFPRAAPAGPARRGADGYLTAIKGFTRWLVRDRRAAENPLVHLSALNAETDVRRERRALSADEFRLSIEAKTFYSKRGRWNGNSLTTARASRLASVTFVKGSDRCSML
jgi:hypothetical protein